MKIVPTIAGLVLAGSFATAAHAGPSQGEVMTFCKAEVKDTFEDVTRIKTSRFRDKASGTFITFRVSTEGADTQKVTCHYKDGITSLTDANGDMIANTGQPENTGS